MRFASSIFALASLSSAALAAQPQSPNNPAPGLAKRDILCSLLNICDLQNDVLNCGKKGNVCPGATVTVLSLIPNILGVGSNGAICQNGVCGATCNNLWDFNWLTGKCQDVSSDTQNCGACGSVCSVANASGAKCQSGTCLATACNSGYTLNSGSCQKVIDTTSDPSNCGKVGNVCKSSWSNGVGSICLNSVCQPQSCNSGWAFDSTVPGCISVTSDLNNCGACRNVCSFPNGKGTCSSGVCTLTSCNSGYYNVNGQCTSLNLQTDSNNCGYVGNVCSFPNGIGSCKAGTCTYSSCTGNYVLSSNKCTAVNTATDTNNCGAVGKVCPVPANGVSATCASGVCGATCKSGYDYLSSSASCIPVTSDNQNCGKCGNVCTYANGVGACNNGVCSLGSCNSGYYNVNGVCTMINTSTDVNNCGSFGNKCPASYPNGSGVQCVAGKCTTTCLGLYSWNGASCQDCSGDINNCGSYGNKCSVANGTPKCTSGVCSVSSCATGYYNINGVCTYYNLQGDVNNCGSVGNKCTFTNGAGTCSGGVCTYTSCVSPYVLSQNVCSKVDLTTDPNHCGSVTTVCPSSYANGGSGVCIGGVCQTTCNSGYDFDFTYSYCRPVSSDINNCGKCGAVCSPAGATASKCVNSQCIATACQYGYTLVSGVCTVVNTQTDPNNCGSVGRVCTFSPSTASGICQAGQCVVTNCGSTSYTLQNGACVKNTASQRARLAKKDSGAEKRTLCPAGETACPIIGSASYDLAVTQHFSAVGDFGAMAGIGGYECLDTTQSLESCGGCASTGEGQDCTKIRGAVGVGCDSGACVVFSCLAGWRPNLAGTRCVRAHTEHSHAQANEHNASRTSAARRHLHARQASHH